MIKRLRIKFICITMVIVTVMLTLLLASQLNFTRNSLMQINREALEAASRDYLNGLEGHKPEKPENERPIPEKPERPGHDKPEKEKPNITRPGEHPCFILSMDSQGNLQASGSYYYDLSDEAVMLDLYQSAAGKTESTGMLWDYQLCYLREDSLEQPYYVFTDISGEMESIGEMAKNSSLIWLLGFFTFLVLSIFLSNWAIRPVEQAWEQQRQFVADASHELKTPLTVILTNAELLREKSENTDQQRFSESIVTMSNQMRGLVDSMLHLARADSGYAEGERERLDFSAVLEQAVLPFEPLYFEAGLTLESTLQPGISVKGNADQLRRVAEILLDNALKYASPGGTVQVELESRGFQCCLRVASPGQMLTARQCRDIFKRFYRVDSTRSANRSYGLGLAIAERIVSDHRGTIWAEGRDGVNTFYVNLPTNEIKL